MTFKIISTIQAILLTAALVHIVHLEGVVHNKESDSTIFVHEESAQQIKTIKEPATIHRITPESFELLPDIQEVQDNILDKRNSEPQNNESAQLNHSAALFGEMRES